jgi:hypothetical protein
MVYYRIYVLDDLDHILVPPEVIECPDDQTAVAAASQTLDAHAIEVWDGARCIIRLSPKNHAIVDSGPMQRA